MSNSPKIYFLKNKEGKFYNSKDDYYYHCILNANYEPKLAKIKEVLNLSQFKDCEIHTTTEMEFMEDMARMTSDVVLVGEYFHQLLCKVSNTLPTISQVNKLMNSKCKQAIDVLIPFTSMQKDFVRTKEDFTDFIQGNFGDYIEQFSKVEMYQAGDVAAIIKAYHLDSKSILGIANKILKKHGAGLL